MELTNYPWNFFQVGGPVRDETGEMHRRNKALIHGWREYPWMINLHEWGATLMLDSSLFFKARDAERHFC